MAAAEDIARIARQEAALAFDAFDETTAFALGSRIRDRALAEKLPIVIDIQLWDRPLFYAALPGSTASNPNWARRKRNVVRIFQRSTYRMVLEKARPDRTFPPGDGLDPADYVLAGGGFPIAVKGAGVIGAIAVSGLPERQDHAVVVEALCAHLGLDHEALALPTAAS
jgi:uncharacterized protein (UPF0303 family)